MCWSWRNEVKLPYKTKKPLDKTSSKVQERYEQSDYPNKISTILRQKMREDANWGNWMKRFKVIPNYELLVIDTWLNDEGVFQNLSSNTWKPSGCELVRLRLVPSLNEMTKAYKNWGATCKGSETYQTLLSTREKSISSVRCWRWLLQYLHFQEDRIKSR